MAKMPKCAHMDKRMQVQAPSGTVNQAGSEIDRWTDPIIVTHIWAAIRPLRGRERMLADGLQSETTHRIYTRYHPKLRASHRLVYKGRPFNIRALLNVDEADRFYEIEAEEGVAT